MKKKFVFVIILIIIAIIAAYFVANKINNNKRAYNIEQITNYNYFVMKEAEKYGVIDASGKVITEAKYENIVIPNPSKDVFICYSNEKGIAIDSSNKQLFAEYNAVDPIRLKNVVTGLIYEKSVLRTEKNGKYGLINLEGKTLLETEYDSIEGLTGHEGELLIKKDEKFGIANIKGTILVKTNYDSITDDNYYNDGIKHGYIVGIKAQNGYNFGYIDHNGKLTIKEEYNDLIRVTDIPTDDGIYLIAAKNGQYGVIKNKKIIVSNEYQSIEYDKTNKIFIVQKGKNYGVANIEGNIIIPVENTKAEAKGQFIYIEKNNIKEVYKPNGEKVNIDYNQTIISTSNDNYKITITSENNGNYYGVLNKDDKQIIKPEYLYIEYAFGDYFIACGKSGKLGVIDNTGKTITELKYDLVQKIQGKELIQALYSNTNTTEIYSKDMEKICEVKDAILENNDNYIKIYSNEELKYISNNGEIIPSSQVFPEKKLYATSKDGKWGYEDRNGKTIIDFEYDFANEINEYGYGSIKKDGKWGVINSEGKIIVEPKYKISDNYGKVEFIGEFLKVNSGFSGVYYTKELSE